MLTTRLRRLRWPFLAACASALVASSVAGAGHDGTNVFHLGTIDSFGSAFIQRSSPNTGVGRFRQLATTEGSFGVVGEYASATGAGAGVFGSTNSTSANAVGVQGRVATSAAGDGSAGVRGTNHGTGPYGVGVWGEQMGSGTGVYGETPLGHGVYGRHSGTTGTGAGVFGESLSTAPNAFGVHGRVASPPPGSRSAGVRGEVTATATTGADTSGVWGSHGGSGSGGYFTSRSGFGVWAHAEFGSGVLGQHTSATGFGPGVDGVTLSAAANAAGVLGRIDSDAVNAAGVKGRNTAAGCCGFGVFGEHTGAGIGVRGESAGGPGVSGSSNSDALNAAGVQGFLDGAGAAAGSAGVFGQHGGTGALGIGVRGDHAGGGNGVYGSVQNSVVNAAGVLGEVLRTGGGGVGVHGHHNGSGYGVYGNTSGAGAGVVGNQTQPAGYAGFFAGRMHVTGMLTKGGGAFKIDHPLDPENKYLQHAFVESPEMKNVYDGVVTTDGRGFATVRLPRYFQALNRDFRYQLTVIGKPGQFVDAMVVKEIADDRFTIQSERPSTKVSWQVTGIRKDRWANANRLQAEVAKPAAERGEYLNPELYGAGKAKSVLPLPAEPNRVPDGAKVATTMQPATRSKAAAAVPKSRRR